MDDHFYKLWEGKKYKDGVELYRRELLENDRNTSAKEALALFLFMAGRRNRVKGAIAEAVSLAKEMLSKGEGLFGANMVIGLEKSRRMGFRESIDNYNKALFAACDIDEKKIALTRLAISMTLAGRAKEAEVIIKELVDLNEITPLIQYLYVNVLRQQNKFGESIMEYKKMTLTRKAVLMLEYVAAILRYSGPNAVEIGRNLPAVLFLLLVILHSIFHVIGADAALNILIVSIVGMIVSRIDLLGVIGRSAVMSVSRTILKSGIRFGIATYLVESVLMYFYNHPNPGEIVTYPEIMIIGLALIIICYISGEYTGCKSGRQYSGALAGALTGTIGISIWAIAQYLITLSWGSLFQVGWDVYNITIAFILGSISGLFGALSGVKFANTSHEV